MPDPMPSPKPPRKVVFLCTGNCIRSQMAEGLLEHLAPGRYRVGSGGTSPAGFVHELAVRVLGEVGIDIFEKSSKSIARLLPPAAKAPDVLVCLCDHAAEFCPDFPDSVRWLYWPVDDPIQATGSIESRLVKFRTARDQIRSRIERALEEGELDAAQGSF